jgi:hypothetical protein
MAKAAKTASGKKKKPVPLPLPENIPPPAENPPPKALKAGRGALADYAPPPTGAGGARAAGHPTARCPPSRRWRGPGGRES